LCIHNGQKKNTRQQQAGRPQQRGGRTIHNVETNGFHTNFGTIVRP
jgi:hypothetical protein